MRLLRYLCLLLVWLPCAAAMAPVDVEPDIANCKRQSEDLWAGSTMTMIEGSVKYTDCLEAAVMALTPRMYREQDAAVKTKAMRESLVKLREAYSDIYSSMDNEAMSCYCPMGVCSDGPTCGSMMRYMYMSEYHAFLERLLRDMARVARGEYRADVN